MLTTSLDPEDATRARSFRVVRDYFNKPLAVEHLQQIAAILEAEEGGGGD